MFNRNNKYILYTTYRWELFPLNCKILSNSAPSALHVDILTRRSLPFDQFRNGLAFVAKKTQQWVFRIGTRNPRVRASAVLFVLVYHSPAYKT